MKTIRLFTIVAAMAGMTACAPEAPGQFTGKIIDASMNTITVQSSTDHQTVTFSTEEADMQEAYGTLLGNTATVDYKGKVGQTTIATKVVANPTYAKAIGRWVEPNPIDSLLVQGVSIEIEGVAQSIGMETLLYKSWELAPEADQIILRGVSEGSGEPYPFEQTAEIIEQDGKFSLQIDGVVLVKKDLI